MNKFLSLAILLLGFASTGDAQSRKTWDLSKGLSDETIANLNLDETNWAKDQTDSDGNTTRWKTTGKMSGTLKAKGVDIKELTGLRFDSKTEAAGLYLSGSCIRQPKKFKIFLPKMIGGQTLTVVARSANSTAEDRDVTFDPNFEYIEGGSKTEDKDTGEKKVYCFGADGNCTIKVKVKETVTDSTELYVWSISSIEFVSFMIDDGDVPEVVGAKKVGYVMSPDMDGVDLAYTFVSSTDGYETTMIDPADESVTAESLQAYDVVAVSPTVEGSAAIVPTLKKAIAFTPMVNLNPALYEPWGLGSVTATGEAVASVAEENYENPLFTTLDPASGIEISPNGNGVTLGDYFANDSVWAKYGDLAAIHQHNAKRNTYILLPYDADAIMSLGDATLITNALAVASATKKDVIATAAPSFTQTKEDGQTSLAISCTTGGAAIYYTTDGTEPTLESQLYTEPLVFTAPATVQAVALADGYTISKVASTDVDVFAQAAAPEITLADTDEGTQITLSSTTPEAKIYFSFADFTSTEAAQLYTEPVVLKDEPATIYAMTTSASALPSAVVSRLVTVKNVTAETICLDTLSHFTASDPAWFVDNSAAGGTGKNSAYYYWGKSAWSQYISTETGEVDEEGNPVIKLDPDPAAYREILSETETDWKLCSSGQVLTGELTLGPSYEVGNTRAGRYADEAIDMVGGAPSTGAITFGSIKSGEPASASITSTKTFTAPFDVVAYIGNGNSKGAAEMSVQVSKDGKEWQTIAPCKLSANQRYWKKTRAHQTEAGEYYVRVAQTGSGTKAQVYDVYVLYNGENSKQYDPSLGIDGVVEATDARLVRTETFTVGGAAANANGKGLYIVRRHYSDGTVNTVKVVK